MKFGNMLVNRRTVSVRPQLAASVLLAAMGLAIPVHADVWRWQAGDGFWHLQANWTPNGVPGVDPNVSNEIRIGGLPGVGNSTVWMNQSVAQMYYFDLLRISSGMTLDMNGRQLTGVNGGLVVTGANSTLIVRASEGPNVMDMIAGNCTFEPGTSLVLDEGSRMRADYLASVGVISGQGTLYLAGGLSGIGLVNTGTIAGSNNGGLNVVSSLTGRLDLDGHDFNGQQAPGELLLASPFSELTFHGDHLNDDFSGTVTMGTGSLLTMNMSNGWTADAVSTLNVSSSMLGAAAQIDGGHFTFGGDLNIGGSQGHLRILADATFNAPADVFLGNNDRLEFEGSTTIEGGLYNVSQGGRIDFDGATQIGGGTFTLVGNTPAQGTVNFNGATAWSGTTTINGFARQVGNASVSTPTTINATVFDMDGNNDAAWTINHSLTVNTQAIESGSQQFDGTLNMNVGAIGRLTVNLADPSAAWTMNGTMNLAGLGVLTTTRISGSRMIVTGDLNMGTGIAQITADTSLQGANVSIAASGTLRMRASTTVDAATSFGGTGTLHNGLDGAMLLNSGASLSQVGLTNSGLLRIGQSGAGVAAVDRFTSTAEAALGIDVGGYLAGTNHDLLLVSGGGTLLNGQLTVSLITGFAPQIGDEFTILSSLGGVSGTFANDPVSFSGGLTYDWTVLYNPNSVVLRLGNIVPTPGSMALLGLGGLIAARRRRSS